MCNFTQDEKPTTKKPKADMPYAEGIYFDMPEDEYHKIPYFSRSGADEILFSAEQFWENSPMNPDRKEKETNDAMDLGSAIHCMLLEPERFKSLYAKYPTVSDYKGKNILKTSEDLKTFLDLVGQKKTGKKQDLINRAVEYLDPRIDVIWDNEIKTFLEEVAESGKRILSDDHTEILTGIEDAIKRRKKMPEILENTRSEVVIIWKDEETGIMCKCMIDAVRPEAIGEVKSFSVKNYNIPLEETMLNDIRYRKYNHQFYVYSEALKTIIKKINTGKAEVFGDVDESWLKEFLKTPNKQFFIMFFRTQAPYQCKSYELERSVMPDATANTYYEMGQMMWKAAIKKLQDHYTRFGTSRWVDEDEVVTLTDEHIPSIVYQSTGF
jgi:hypothetical protein